MITPLQAEDAGEVLPNVSSVPLDSEEDFNVTTVTVLSAEHKFLTNFSILSSVEEAIDTVGPFVFGKRNIIQ